MAARNKRRGRHRGRGRFGFLYVVLSAAAVLAAIVLGSAVFFRVETVQVTGQSRYTAEQIIEAAEVEQGDNLFALDRVKASKQIISRLPYVDSVSITRRLPDGLNIAVTECTGAAAIEGEGVWWILNAGGKFVERTDAAGVAGLPPITGLTPVAPMVGSRLEVPEEQTIKLESLMALLQAINKYGMTAQVQSYDLTAVNVIEAGYAGRFTLKMPMSGADYDYLMNAADRAVKEKLDESTSGVMDLSRLESEGILNVIPYS
ncbi:POTRA domain protein, FtsQ-type [uncultured Eubacteriales bacterium]|uniref:POTRA domain protein, FtsQ-type n=1 Tax=uncultured Eubacteriales bacterium TaxID=172733 RepID=A0A212J958_9FIRM|nr:POTRA domain protein, FtsQ-type [uncultured Eubacteriales bacterium]